MADTARPAPDAAPALGKRPRGVGLNVEDLLASEVLSSLGRTASSIATTEAAGALHADFAQHMLVPPAFHPEQAAAVAAAAAAAGMPPAALGQSALAPHPQSHSSWPPSSMDAAARSTSPEQDIYEVSAPRTSALSIQEAPRDGPGRSALYGRKQLKGADANFVFYYVLQSVDPATAQMVAVGIDPRKTGHYSYHSVVPTQPRLANAHNKRTVTDHLERTYAAVHQADKALLARVLSPTPEQAHEISVLAADGDILGDEAQARFADVLFPGRSQAGQAHLARTDEARARGRAPVPRHPCQPAVKVVKPPSAVVYLPEPVVEDPALLQGWGSWETIKSTAPNGGKQIDFVLVGRDDPARRMLAVKASEVKPDDRRYVYATAPAFGSMQLKSRAAAEQWLARYFLAAGSKDEAQNETEQECIERFTAELSSDEAVAAWVLQKAAAGPLKLVQGWAAALARAVDLGVPGETGFRQARARDVAAAVDAEAASVLEQLQTTMVSLAVMEETGLAVVVHRLKCHHSPQIRQLAIAICARWQVLATRATTLSALALDVQRSQAQSRKAQAHEPAAASARVLLPRGGSDGQGSIAQGS